MATYDQTSRYSFAYVLALSIFVFLVDAMTPLGYAEWVLYVLPVLLCVLGSRADLPFRTALGLLPLMIAGYFLSPPGADPSVAIFNRAMAVFTVAGVAFLARRVIVEKLTAQHLMWIEKGRAEVARNILGEGSLSEISEKVVHALARYMGAQVAVCYRRRGDTLVRVASFALDGQAAPEEIAVGTGLVGAVAREGRAEIVRMVPEDYLPVQSATARTQPAQVLIAPITMDGRVTGVMEFGFLHAQPLNDELKLLSLVAEKIGSALRSADYRQHLKDLLEETQTQSEELQAQQEELRVTNEELAEHARALQESQSELEAQHSELEQANVQLEERNQLLEEQKRNLAAAQSALQQNTVELERANRYKSEFLANMSHELRTPLNSSLILSSVLAENKTGSLSEEQVRYARTIHSANSDLLTLINDILDLSKIEAGQVDLALEPVAVQGAVTALERTFEPLAAEKGLALRFAVEPGVPAELITDGQRLQQVLKNLLSNAIKFTQQGEVRLEVGAAGGRVRFAVHDTGIGIAPEQQEVIFEAFRQADGSTSRTFGGTGLGLSISRQLAALLGGDVSLTSTPGVGSVFVLDIPAVLQAPGQVPAVVSKPVPPAPAPLPAPAAPPRPAAVARPAKTQDLPAPTFVPDDRDRLSRERVILVIEDDEKFARIMYDMAHELGFDCLLAPTGTEAMRLAEQYKPSGILLDIGLPDQSGLAVLEKIKRNPATRHLPVHVLSVDDYTQSALELGAVGYALKPVARDQLIDAIGRLEKIMQTHARRVLIVEDNVALGESLAALLGGEDVEITHAGTVASALDLLSSRTFDCMVMDLMLPDGSGFDLLERIAQGGKYAFPPVIVYTGRVLTRDEEQRLQRYSRSIIIKGARSPERLLDEVTLFLHRVESSLPPDQQQMLKQARQRDNVFDGRRILVAEDDVRNVFALTSILEPLGATVVVARNGQEALARLEDAQPVDMVLMDLMMPGMDGLTATRELRKNPAFKRLPVIALTAKAMPDDRRLCLEAGASDYIAKPIVVDQLISLCRVWMPK
ncbi:MAG TPA: response regulator [Noviherbaspirillum sp.]